MEEINSPIFGQEGSASRRGFIEVRGANEHNLKNVSVNIRRGSLTVITGLSGSGKSSLAFDTILAESQRRFFYTLSNYSRQFLDMGTRPAVKSVSGLSPAIALEQNETQTSPKATVGTLSDTSELLGVLFARFAKHYCPQDDLETTQKSADDILEDILKLHQGKYIIFFAPIAQKKKGNFATKLEKLATRGYLKALIDGELRDLNPVPVLVKDEKHDIRLLMDQFTLSEKNRNRILRNIESALTEGEGYGEFSVLEDAKSLDWKALTFSSFSISGGCPKCGYSWPKLDSRYFSTNSLGKCKHCNGYGVPSFSEDEYEQDSDWDSEEDENPEDIFDKVCPYCRGSGLDPTLQFIRFDGKHIHDLVNCSIDKLMDVLHRWKGMETYSHNPAFIRVTEEILGALKRIQDLGLGYLSLSRRVQSLSGGESQRIKLAGVLAESLRGVLYVFDEPSQGLHASELQSLVGQLHRLRDLGNTLILVDHDPTIMEAADEIIDLGPGGGQNGGNIVAQFSPQNAKQFSAISATAKYLSFNRKLDPSQLILSSQKKSSEVSRLDKDANQSWIKVTSPSQYNINFDAFKIPLGKLSVICGVSGAGKTTLARNILFNNLLASIHASNADEKFVPHYCKKMEGADLLSMVWNVDRRPIARSNVSMPASYLDIFAEIRQLFGEMPEAQIAGLTQRSFSLSVDGGRCEECRGRGVVHLKMRFLSDAKVLCAVCKGKRYKDFLLDIKFSGLNIAEVLSLTIDEAMEHFKNFRKIVRNLKPAVDMGLGYLKLGQPSATLSGGEAQRLKMVPLLSKRLGEGSLLVIDEPTTGLHFEDVFRLKKCLRELCDRGTTVVVIEHNEEILKEADWILELGPGAAELGGKLIYQGDFQTMVKLGDKTPTSRILNNLA